MCVGGKGKARLGHTRAINWTEIRGLMLSLLGPPFSSAWSLVTHTAATLDGDHEVIV